MNKRYWLLAIPAVLIIAVLGFILWGSFPAGPSVEALQALKSDALVQVDVSSSQVVFKPAGREAVTGFIFYPGGRVDYRAYAPQLRQVAASGTLVVVVRMPLSLAVFGANKADAVITAFPQIKQWAVGGHSLGGSMAALYTYNHPGKIKGLVLWASYPASNNNLSDRDLAVVSISGILDGLATPAKIAASKSLLPDSTRWVAIQGGNHAQFGSYGAQSGDNPAQLSAQAQLDQTVSATLDLLKQIEK